MLLIRNLRIIILLLLANFSIHNLYANLEKINFWNQHQKGANIFNAHIDPADIKAAKEYHITFIRLALDKFPSQQRDFLIGNADHYTQLVPEDLAVLKAHLDICAAVQMPVVLTMLNLPGSRWKQLNHNKDDLRLWDNISFQQQAAKFWQDLAEALKDHPAIVGYNILNEPHPERLYATTDIPLYEVNQEQVQKQLAEFYQLVIEAIRKVDSDTPIILDSTTYGDPQTFKQLQVHPDANLLYSFHMYEPYEYTNFEINQKKWRYPGQIAGKNWDKQALENYLQPVIAFQQKHQIPSNRILVGEFGGNRFSPGLPQYFKDLTAIFKANNWHFAFYAFREDVWDGMDYELGNQKLPWTYWQSIEKGEKPTLARKADAPAFKVLKEALQPSSAELPTHPYEHPTSFHDPKIVEILKKDPIINKQPMHEFLAEKGKMADFEGKVYLVTLASGIRAVFKIFETDDADDAKAEVAAYQASLVLGFPYIPPTVLRTVNGMHGSLQLFIDTSIDLLKENHYKQAIAKADPIDHANLRIFYFIFGQWDSGAHNLLLYTKDPIKPYLIAIDNSGIGNKQYVRYGELPFVRVLYSDAFHSNDWWDTPFPFDAAITIEKPTLNNLKQAFGERVPASFYKRFKAYNQPFRYVIYQNSLWRQFHAYDPGFIKAYAAHCPPDTKQAIQKLDLACLRNTIFAGVQDAEFATKGYYQAILERRDQVLKYFNNQ